MVTVAGNEAEAERTLEGLTAAKNYVRHELAERLRLRKPRNFISRSIALINWRSSG